MTRVAIAVLAAYAAISLSTSVAMAADTAPAAKAEATANPAAPAGGGLNGKGYPIGRSNTPGWSLMSPEERKEHASRMHAFQTYEDCRSYHEAHHAQMEMRAREQGRTLRSPKANACERMKERGRLR